MRYFGRIRTMLRSRAGALESVLPATGWLRRYDGRDFSMDLSAGLVVAVVLIPQSMAYALLAGLPPVYGLYASIVPAVVYALFGTSRHMPVGPPALMALLTFTGVSAVAEPGSGEFVSLALLLALMAGMLQFAMGALRLGFVANFIPHPVLSGFIFASALVIALSQMGNFLGISNDSAGRSTAEAALTLASNLAAAHPATLSVGAVSLVFLLILGWLAPRFPGSLVVVAGATVAAWLLGLEGKGVAVVGEVPQGLPALTLPTVDIAMVQALLPTALAVAFVGFVESISVAKAVAAKEGYKISSDKELRALGLANASAAVTSGFPVAGSFSRTAVNYQAGARTQMAPVIAAGGVLLTILFLTPLFYHLPNATLAAIILVAVWRMLDFEEARRIFRLRKTDGYAMMITFALTLLLGVEEGIICGALFALVAFVRKTAYPDVTELGYVEKEGAFLGVRSYPEARRNPDALVVRFDSPLYYANAAFLEEWLIKRAAERPKLKYIVIDCRGVDSIDATAVEGLEALISEFGARKIRVMLSHVKLPVRLLLQRANWRERFGDDIVHPTVRDAMRHAEAMTGGARPVSCSETHEVPEGNPR